MHDLGSTVEEIVAEEGDRVAVAVRNSGRGRASGIPIEGRYYVACTVRDGLIASGREYQTREQAMEAFAPADRQTGGVPYVWKLSTVFTPQAWPFARSASLHTVGSRSGS